MLALAVGRKMKKLFTSLLLSFLFVSPAFAGLKAVSPNAGSFTGTLGVTNGGTGATSLGCGLTNSGSVLNTSFCSPLSVTATSDTVDYTTYSGRIIRYSNVSAIASTLPAATATGFTQGFAYSPQNIGYGDVTITTTSSINGSFYPFVIHQNDGCDLFSFNSNYSSNLNACAARLYNPTFGTGTMTSSIDPRLLLTTATNTPARAYYAVTTGYLTTTTSTAQARPDYNPGTLAAKGLLIEQGATQIYTSPTGNSGLFANGGGTRTSDSITGPTGLSMQSAHFTEDTGTSGHQIAPQDSTQASGTKYSISMYAKKGTATVLQLAPNSTYFPGTTYANYDLNTCTVGTTSGVTARTDNIASLGICRLMIDGVQATGSGTGLAVRMYLTNNNASATRAPSYTGTSQDLYVMMMNITPSDLTSSYIGTAGTRSAESYTLSSDVLAQWNPKKGAVCVDNFILNANTASGVIVGGSDSANAILKITAGGNLGSNDGTTAADYAVAPTTAGTAQTVCVNYGDGTSQLAKDGTLAATATFSSNGWGITSPKLFSDNAGANGLNGYVKGIRIFPTKLSATDLARVSVGP